MNIIGVIILAMFGVYLLGEIATNPMEVLIVGGIPCMIGLLYVYMRHKQGMI